MKTPVEDLTPKQLLDAYKEQEIAFGQFKTQAAEEKSGIEKAHADTVRNLKAQYAELEKEHAKFKALHAKNPEIFLTDYEHHNGLYVNKAHPEWGYFCGNCLPKGSAVHMRECDAGWQCNACPNFIYKPGF